MVILGAVNFLKENRFEQLQEGITKIKINRSVSSGGIKIVMKTYNMDLNDYLYHLDMISNSDIEDAKIEEIEEMAEEIAKELIEHLLNDEILIDGEFFEKH